MILVLQSVFLTRLLVSGILFSNSALSVLYLVFITKLLVSILSTVATNLLYSVSLTTLFSTTLDNLLQSAGAGFNLSISSLSTSVFKLDKFVFNARLEVSTCVILSMSAFVA